MDSACVWQPFREGTLPTRKPSLSRSMTTVNSRDMLAFAFSL
jgi:hypothetical protein